MPAIRPSIGQAWIGANATGSTAEAGRGADQAGLLRRSLVENKGAAAVAGDLGPGLGGDQVPAQTSQSHLRPSAMADQPWPPPGRAGRRWSCASSPGWRARAPTEEMFGESGVGQDRGVLQRVGVRRSPWMRCPLRLRAFAQRSLGELIYLANTTAAIGWPSSTTASATDHQGRPSMDSRCRRSGRPRCAACSDARDRQRSLPTASRRAAQPAGVLFQQRVRRHVGVGDR